MLRQLNWIILLITTCNASSIFKTCNETDFCNRLRHKDDGTIFYIAEQVDCNFILKNNKDSKELLLTAQYYGNAFRIIIDEHGVSSRYRLNGVLIRNEGENAFCRTRSISTDNKITFYSTSSSESDLNGIGISFNPFKIEFYSRASSDIPVATVNAKNRFTFETEEPHVAIAMDVVFHNGQRAYGIPGHADRLSLRRTVSHGSDPYRLYNIDQHYELDSTTALYGSVPVLYAHGANYTMGIFWHNAAETWIDVQNKDEEVYTYFISESGVLDFFALGGPAPQDSVRTYASLTGSAPLPQYFTLGYHQSRWNYMSEEDVQTVVAEFDNHDFPLDVIWLDIEYTDGKKYFTWNPKTFPTPLKMLQNLTATNRKLVTIIDPHIKKETGYFVYDQALQKDYFVKNPDGTVFEGQCWPGLSSYLDFLNPATQEFYAGLYAFDKFNGTTENTYIWNDMNEPSVFDNTLEKTFPKDVLHYGNVKHRDIHNIYGFLQTKGTYQGLINRSKTNRRPFILSRSHFAGSQRYTAIWTGDNTADWGYLAASLPMCLSEALAGISFCGADIGGFFDEPSEELLQRWYQLGAWLPFFREHSTFQSKRREPYVFQDHVQVRIRTALKQRYAHLPLWYTLFWEHFMTGDPIIRPLYFSYPHDLEVFDIDTQLLIGNQIMVAPVLEPGVNSINVYFPGGKDEMWFDIATYHIYDGFGYSSINVTLDSIPVYYRGGSIISRKDISRPSSVETYNDPYTLYIIPNNQNFAEGALYVDDMETFNYQKGEYMYIKFTFDNNILKTRIDEVDVIYEVKAKVDRIIYVNPSNVVKHAVVTQGSTNKKVAVTHGKNYVEISNLNLDLMDLFEIHWQ